MLKSMNTNGKTVLRKKAVPCYLDDKTFEDFSGCFPVPGMRQDIIRACIARIIEDEDFKKEMILRAVEFQ
jgi:hypothetical protein